MENSTTYTEQLVPTVALELSTDSTNELPYDILSNISTLPVIIGIVILFFCGSVLLYLVVHYIRNKWCTNTSLVSHRAVEFLTSDAEYRFVESRVVIGLTPYNEASIRNTTGRQNYGNSASCSISDEGIVLENEYSYSSGPRDANMPIYIFEPPLLCYPTITLPSYEQSTTSPLPPYSEK